jgi:L,D-peptidoglycan transpeptidase YkuD (ErfK/YbiS/YcfS/YnhG family)
MVHNSKKSYLMPALVLLGLLTASCMRPAVSPDEAPPKWMQAALETMQKTSSQVLLVASKEPSGFRARLYALEKQNAIWRNALPPMPALIGGKGFAPPGEKKEGDLRTPSGVFPLKRTFGYAPKIDSRMPYRRAGKEDIWVDDPSSPDYNRWLLRGETRAASFEVMKRPDDRYEYGIVIEYNTDPVIPGAGSAIFIHVRGGKNMPTLGCVALSEGDMLKLLRWLDPAAEPLAVLGTRESLILPNRGLPD